MYRYSIIRPSTFITNLHRYDLSLYQQAISVYHSLGYRGKFWFSDKATDAYGRDINDEYIAIHGNRMDTEMDMFKLFKIISYMRDMQKQEPFISISDMQL